MQTQVTIIGLLLSLGALAVAGYAITSQPADTSDTEARLDEMDARLGRIEATLRAQEPPDEPTLVGLATETDDLARESVPATVTAAGRTLAPEGAGAGAGATGDVITEEATEQIRELVDEAVEKKATQIQVMENKKPSIDVFSKTLGLTDAQREIVEQEVLIAQREIRSILDTPTADGTNLLDELVEVFAEGMARPGEKSARGMQWFGRILTEQVPGTSETYAAQAERAKNRLRETLQRELTEEQHALYESWQMDPSEIEDVPDSPWKDIEARVIERAKDLGAEIPDER